MMRHRADIEGLGKIVGFDPNFSSDEDRASLELCFDEVFEKGYQAGLADAREVLT